MEVAKETVYPKRGLGVVRIAARYWQRPRSEPLPGRYQAKGEHAHKWTASVIAAKDIDQRCPLLMPSNGIDADPIASYSGGSSRLLSHTPEGRK